MKDYKEYSAEEKHNLLCRAFSYLIDQASPGLCRCFDEEPSKFNRMHRDECVIAIAMDGAGGLRQLPSPYSDVDPE